MNSRVSMKVTARQPAGQPVDSIPGRRQALLTAVLAFAGIRAAAATDDDPLVIIDGWVVKQSEIRLNRSLDHHAV